MNKKLITLDLDGTLLRSDKTISKRNYQALNRAAMEGHLIVPCTGRFYEAMPKEVKDLPFVKYAITINGACAERIPEHEVLFREEMSCDLGCEILEFLKQYPVMYDVYSENWGWVKEDMWHALQAEDFGTPAFRKMAREYKSPVPDLIQYLREGRHSVQKAQAYLPDSSIRLELSERIKERFPMVVVSSSVDFNIEINAHEANKGNALKRLADILHIPMEDTIAFGDGSNDLTMLHGAGVGVVMANALEEVKQAGDMTTASNDEDGVAAALEKLLGW